MAGGLLPFQQVLAQEDAGRVVVRGVNTDTFPNMGVEFEVYDPLGGFVTDLNAQDVLVDEEGKTQPVKSLELLQPGVQFTIAFNLAPELSNKYAGVSRMDNILQRLGGWARAQKTETPDAVSLATNTGLQIIRSRSPQEWEEGLRNLETANLLGEESSLNALTRAVDLAADTGADSGMKQAILYITPLPNPSAMSALPSLADRAASQGISIFVWLVASTSTPETSPDLYAAVENLATSTGGSIFLYSGQEALPDPDGYLNPLRYFYRANYDSTITASGSYDIGVEISKGNSRLISETRPVYLNVLPPNPIFLSPPSTIERTWTESPENGQEELVPKSVEIQIVVEYGDGHQRPLKASRLYVDGVVAAENTSEPFDTFVWDLSGIQTTSRHVLVAEVEDTLGLMHHSIDTPVDVDVEQQSTAEAWKTVLSVRNLLIFGGVLAAGAILVLTLGFVGRRAQRQTAADRKAMKDPLTQPVPQRTETRKKPAASTINRPTWPRYAAGGLSSAPAWLLRVPDAGGQPAVVPGSRISPPSNPASAIPLSRRETKLGSDEKAVNYKLNSPTVSPVHARIVQTAEGGFLIQDAGSVAGTWVNYAPVPAKGVLLKHGDMVQIGKVAFRFELANPPEEPQPRITNRQELP